MGEKMKAEDEINKLKVQLNEQSSQKKYQNDLMNALNRHAPP